MNQSEMSALPAKQIIHIISFEPITSRASANSFHELSREGVCSPGHFLKGAESNFLENQINWYYA